MNEKYMTQVTVIIPAYNAMTYLPATLDSVLQQTFTDFELLIINDGSKDNIAEWVANLTDKRVKLISQTNQGVSVARNTGIAHASGEYIAFLDADDLWEPTKLEKQVCCLEANPAVGLVYTWTTLIDEFCQPNGIVFAYNVEGNVWEHMLIEDVVCNGSNAIVRRDCFEKVGGFNPNLSSAADFDMWTRIAACYPFAVIKEYLVYYRQSANSMSKNYQKMAADLHHKIENSFKQIPSDLLYLRNRAYGHMNRWLAWSCIYDGDYNQAVYFRNQALLHNPHLLYSKNFWKLSLKIFLTPYFGDDAAERLCFWRRDKALL